MPAHIRTALTQNAALHPIIGGALALGHGREFTSSNTAAARTGGRWRRMCWGSDALFRLAAAQVAPGARDDATHRCAARFGGKSARWRAQRRTLGVTVPFTCRKDCSAE